MLPGDGGAVLVEQDFDQLRGELRVTSCKSRSHGGGMQVRGNFNQQPGGAATFSSCQASGRGGCISVERSMNLTGQNSFHGCTARGTGKSGRNHGVSEMLSKGACHPSF